MDNFNKQFKDLKNVRMRTEASERGFELFMNRVDQRLAHANKPEQVEARVPILVRFAESVRGAASFATTAGSQARAAVMTPLSLIVVTVMVFGSFGAYAGKVARNSTPDQPVAFTLKSALEKGQLALSFSSEEKAEVRIDHLARRVHEARQVAVRIADNPDANEEVVSQAVQSAQSHAEEVHNEIAKLSESTSINSQDVVRVTQLIGKLTTYTIAVNELESVVPEEVKPEVEELASALSAISEIAETIELSDDATEHDTEFSVGEGSVDEVFESEGGDTPTNTTSTLPIVGDGGDEQSAAAETERDAVESNSAAVIFVPQPKQPVFDLEEDTKPVGIGL